MRIDSFNELPKDKRPPRDLWGKPHRLEEYFEDVFSTDKKDKGKTFYEVDPEEIE